MKKNKIIKGLLYVLFQFSSLSIIIGITISMIFILGNNNNDLGQILPIIIMSGISSIMFSIYMYILTKEYALIKMHMSKNWIKYEWIAIFINLFNMIFSMTFITVASLINLWDSTIIPAIILITISFIISLLGMGFHQYFFYKVRINYETRKNGENKD